MAEAEKEKGKEQAPVDKRTGEEYQKTKEPLISKKGIIIVGACFALYTGLLVVLGLLGGGSEPAEAKEPDGTGEMVEGEGAGQEVVVEPLYTMGSVAATVSVANTTRMATVGSVNIILDEKKGAWMLPYLGEKVSPDISTRVLTVIEDTLRAYEYSQLQQKGMKEKLQEILPARIIEANGWPAGSIKQVILKDYRLPK